MVLQNAFKKIERRIRMQILSFSVLVHTSIARLMKCSQTLVMAFIYRSAV
jgi:hypothetical protein